MTSVTKLSLATRAAMRLRHGVRLARDVDQYARDAGAWWLVPVMAILGLAALAVTATSSALPLTVYTLF